MAVNFIGVPHDDIMCNCIVKRYPDGSASILASDRCIWRAPGFEALSDAKGSTEKYREFWDAVEDTPDVERSQYALARREAAEAQRAAKNLDRAKRRARSALRDLARSNEFSVFVTLTLDRKKVDRYDMGEVTKILNRWLDNHVRRDGLCYALVPELHRDGAIHFHGFFNDALPLVDSGHKDSGGHTVYNLPAWTLGFTTAIRLYGDRRAAVGYCCKYITKAQEKIGGRWYYSGGALQRPRVEFCRCDFEELSHIEGVAEFTVSDVRAKLVSLEISGV